MTGLTAAHLDHGALRVLITNEHVDRLEFVAQSVAGLGHEVIARRVELDEVGAATASERPDVALVALGDSSLETLELVERIVDQAACPVVVLIPDQDSAFVHAASRRGVFVFVTERPDKQWQFNLDLVLRHYAEYRRLESAFGRRAITERAKGILMERHSIDEASAFKLLRDRARSSNRKLVEIAGAVLDGHTLLPMRPALVHESLLHKTHADRL